MVAVVVEAVLLLWNRERLVRWQSLTDGRMTLFYRRTRRPNS